MKKLVIVFSFVLLVAFVSASCNVVPVGDCDSPRNKIMGLSDYTDAHAEFPYVDYDQVLCCDDALAETCDVSNEIGLCLSRADDAHASVVNDTSFAVCADGLKCFVNEDCLHGGQGCSGTPVPCDYHKTNPDCDTRGNECKWAGSPKFCGTNLYAGLTACEDFTTQQYCDGDRADQLGCVWDDSDSDYSEVLSLSSLTNAHLAEATGAGSYDLKLCCNEGEGVCDDTCAGLGYECGFVCGLSCGTCGVGYSCNPQGQCVGDIGYVASICKDYTESGEDACEDNDDLVGIFYGLYWEEDDEHCKFKENGIGCKWHADEGCLQNTEFEAHIDNGDDCTPPAPCSYTETITGDCSHDDALTITYSSVPINSECVLDSKTIPCVGTEKLGFFGFFNFVLTLFCIGLIYGFLIIRGKKNA